MAEKINKLFGQALDMAVPETWTTLSHDQLMRVRDVFAELIVRECSQFVEDKFDFCGDEIIIAEKILQHFGVEE